MNIIDYILEGKENAVTREELTKSLGYDDRAIRSFIEEARKKYCIINDQDGEGYYRPKPNSLEDRLKAERWLNQEKSRANATLASLEGAEKFLKNN